MARLWSVLFLTLALAANDNHKAGVELYKQHQYAAAITLLQRAAAEEKPDSDDFHETALLIGQSYFQLAQVKEAIPWLQKLPEVSEANYMLGYAYLQTRQIPQSEQAFARLFHLPPVSAAAHLMTAQMMMKKQFEDDAATQANTALSLDARTPEAHFLLGEIAIYSGRLDEGIKEMLAELSINPGFSQAWYRLGDAYTRQQNWTAAIPNLERAIWLNPDFSGPFILLGRCYSKTGNLLNAEGILRRALVLDPNNSSANYLLGRVLIAEGKAEEGKTFLDKVKDKVASE